MNFCHIPIKCICSCTAGLALRASILFPRLFKIGQAMYESSWQGCLGSVKPQLLLQLFLVWSQPASFKLLLPAGQEEKLKNNPTILWKAFINVAGVTSSGLTDPPPPTLLSWDLPFDLNVQLSLKRWHWFFYFLFLRKAATALQKRNTSAPLASTGHIFISCMLLQWAEKHSIDCSVPSVLLFARNY